MTALLPAHLRPKHVLSLSFDQPLGTQLDAGGYHVDLRVKAGGEPIWPPPAFGPLPSLLWVGVCQFGLAAHERFVDEQDERWLATATSVGEHLLASMRSGGGLDGALAHGFAYPHTFHLEPGWVSAMAQGEAASLLARLHRSTGEERFAVAAERSLAPIAVATTVGGAGIGWRGGWWPEEYPTDPPSLVLNGGVFAMLGQYDVSHALGSEPARRAFVESADLLAANIAAWDLGWWTLYDLYPHVRANVASLAYQELHVTLLQALDRCEPRSDLARAARRFQEQRASRVATARAFAAKVAFRRAVPRRASAHPGSATKER